MTTDEDLSQKVASLLTRIEALEGAGDSGDGSAKPEQDGLGLYETVMLVGLADAGWSPQRLEQFRRIAGQLDKHADTLKDSTLPERAAFEAVRLGVHNEILAGHFEERGTLKIIQAAAAGRLVTSGKKKDKKRRRIPTHDWEGAVWYVPRVDSEGNRYWRRPFMTEHSGPRVNPIDDPGAQEDAIDRGEENDIYALQGLVGTLAKDDWSEPDWYDIRLWEHSVRRLFGLTSAATVAGEQKAIAEAVDMLKKNTDTPREAVIRMAQENHGVSYRGAKDRVWPTARERAGLPRLASAGRKKDAAG